ncbi:MAG: tetratricopeptide repeat protein, partial [Deltaproteobacteria bacterium]|nr:tetratricopeptide repeat protein [Deltaproteobacteria bacterium]
MDYVEKWRQLNARVIAFHQQGWYVAAVKPAEQALELATNTFGSDDLRVAESQKNLALVYYSQANSVEAAAGHEKQKGAHGDPRGERPNSTKSIHSLVLKRLASNKRAMANSKEKHLGVDHPEVAECRRLLKTMFERQSADGGSLAENNRAAITASSGDVRSSCENFGEPFPEQVRFQQEFAAELSKSDLNAAIKGMTISIGQQGAF